MAVVGEHAIVLGASMSGLLAARVLADSFSHVTVVERDTLSADPVTRRGVPQGRHAHALLARGANTLAELFPGILGELVAAGAPVLDDKDMSIFYVCNRGHVMMRAGQWPDDPEATPIHQPSRAMLECHVRRRLQELANVTVSDGHDVTELTSTPDGKRVNGVRVIDRSSREERDLAADLVVDAMGRAAHTPGFLERLGYGRPPEQHIVMHTTYVTQSLRIPPGTVHEKLTAVTPTPGRPTGLFMFGYENDAWVFTVFGMSVHEPPRDLEGMLAFAEDYAPAHVLAAVRAGEPLTPVVVHRMPSSQWRRYDKMSRFPAGLLVVGDAMCSFNPIYGQGMSVAAMDALALRAALRGGADRLARRYFRAAAKSIGVAWALSTNADLDFPEVEGQRTPVTRLANRFGDKVLTACETDVRVLIEFSKVTAMVNPPTRLLRPAFLIRVVRANRRHRRESRTLQRADAKIAS